LFDAASVCCVNFEILRQWPEAQVQLAIDQKSHFVDSAQNINQLWLWCWRLKFLPHGHLG
jgi:hypothetical protein